MHRPMKEVNLKDQIINRSERTGTSMFASVQTVNNKLLANVAITDFNKSIVITVTH